jgi:hypothetical protein
MGDMPAVLTNERPLNMALLAGMAPDDGTWRAADALAREGKASQWGQAANGDTILLWATFPEGRRSDALASVLLPTLHVACTCGGARFPCRHVLALLLLDHAAPGDPASAPPWAKARLETNRRAARPVAPPADDNRIATAAAGLAELARWLNDRLDRGLVVLPAEGRAPWLAAADRLAAAYAPGAADELRDLATLIGEGDDWPARLLPRLGRLALLAEAFRRLDTLPPGERGDVLAAAGLPPRPGDDRVSDTWLALGRRQLPLGRRRLVQTWLLGLSTGRWALLEEYRTLKRLEGLCLPTGATLRGEMAFLPSAWPLAAQPADALSLVENAPAIPPPGAAVDVAAAVAGYAAARAANPWLHRYPMLLTGVLAEPAPDGWRLRDRSGQLLFLPPRFGHGWHLLALGGGRSLTLFGHWDGTTLTPLSIWYEDGWRDLAVWKALP